MSRSLCHERRSYQEAYADLTLHRPTQIVYWVKSSNPSNDTFRRVSRDDRSAFPFHRDAVQLDVRPRCFEDK